MSQSSSLDIAIIGVSARLPGASSPRQFWDNLIAGNESISLIRDEELVKDFFLIRNPMYVKAAGCLDYYDCFDPAFFGIPAPLAPMMSPEHRLFIESAWAAMEDGGYNPETYPGEVGVYGACNPESIARYKSPPDWVSPAKEGLDYTYGWSPDSLAPNVLRYLGLKGEAVSLTTFCCGIHYAVHFAIQSLLLGQCDLAIAGGVIVRVPHRRGYLYEPTGVMSHDGHCRPFDAKGTGAALSSGVVVFLLKRAESALADGDHIYAVLKGSAFNNNGRTSMGYGVAQPERLSQCIANAMAMGEVAAETVTLLECFGIGHPIADAVEIQAAEMGFGSPHKSFCAVGSVKGNVGSCGVAAGGAGLLKAALSLYHGKIPATINCSQINPQIPFGQNPFYVQRETTNWDPACGVRRAGVTALGGAGYNAHIVLEEPPRRPSLPTAAASTPCLITLSARTAEALHKMRVGLEQHLRHHAELNLQDVAYTLNVGRKNFEHRWAAVVFSHQDLQDKLAGRVVDGMVKAEIVGRGGASASESAGGIVGNSLVAVAESWTRGHPVDWDSHYAGQRHYRVPLPTYPFARERHWLSSGEVG